MKRVICFGEVLWDMLPTGNVAGGAPMNVAFHLNQFGWNCKMISKVGKDPLGEELMDFLKSKSIPVDFIQIDLNHPTGTVQVQLDTEGIPSYDIVQEVAYDFLEVNEQIQKEVADADVFIYGSLAARNQTSRKVLMELLSNTGTKIFDVNLRAPHFDKPVLEALLEKSDIVKMNDEELEIIVGWYSKAGDLENNMRFLHDKLNLESLIITRGKEGASVLDRSGEIYHSSYVFQIQVADTVGCGDGFLSGFVNKMLQGKNLPTCLRFASGMGAYLATQRGATPVLSEIIIEEFLESQGVK